MTNLYWDINPNDFMKKVDMSVEKRTLMVSEEIFDGVVDRSPVDKGNFRQSWNVSLNTPDTSTVTGGSSGNPLSAPRFPKIKVSRGDKVIINNSTPYGVELERGHSDQAPLGMVDVTLASLGT